MIKEKANMDIAISLNSTKENLIEKYLHQISKTALGTMAHSDSHDDMHYDTDIDNNHQDTHSDWD